MRWTADGGVNRCRRCHRPRHCLPHCLRRHRCPCCNDTIALVLLLSTLRWCCRTCYAGIGVVCSVAITSSMSSPRRAGIDVQVVAHFTLVSLPSLRWHCCHHCAGVIVVHRSPSSHWSPSHVALALSPTLRWRRRPCRVVAHIALALSPLLSWRLCRPRRHTSSVSWPLLQWHCCPSCCPRHARVVALLVMALSPSLRWCRCRLLIALVPLATFVS